MFLALSLPKWSHAAGGRHTAASARECSVLLGAADAAPRSRGPPHAERHRRYCSLRKIRHADRTQALPSNRCVNTPSTAPDPDNASRGNRSHSSSLIWNSSIVLPDAPATDRTRGSRKRGRIDGGSIRTPRRRIDVHTAESSGGSD